ncbi:dTDP-4-dehydrorhamnose reductase family protein [Treponema denticola]|uniref:dTDP-4-dehydrorhamnose reductase family protein n=1 Tax=Treponema denticola TaxID=158 RepID=UPI0021042ED7|nr:SDR family oxidoreductase [Treponema denticola]UTY25858.1 SDR family oxidoreductase [Treponema denticola]
MKKILILGAGGMAGHMVYYYLASLKKYSLYTVCHKTFLTEHSFILDVRDTKKLTAILVDVQPDVIINCIGVLIKGAQNSIENAVYINAYYPHLLSDIISKNLQSSKLIHISTDCVFSGEKGNYKFDDKKDALDVYGMTKNLGEVINGRDLTIRTSIIGPELKKNGEGLFHWLFSNRAAKELNGYTKSVWSGVTTLELAKAIDFAINTDLIGLQQLSNNKQITKYDLLKLVTDTFNLSVEMKPVDGVISDKSIVSSILDYSVPSYSVMLQDLHNFMSKNKELYTQYEETL